MIKKHNHKEWDKIDTSKYAVALHCDICGRLVVKGKKPKKIKVVSENLGGDIKMDAVLLLAVFIICLLFPFYLAKLWFWLYFWSTIGIVLILYEIISFILTKKTMSQQFWAWLEDDENNFKKKLILIGMSIFWIFLLIHLFVH